jgi:hypothetical protein
MKFTINRKEGEVIDYTDPKNCAIAHGLKSKGYVRVCVSPTSWVGQTTNGVINFGLIPYSENQKAQDICLVERNVSRVEINLPKPIRATNKNIEGIKSEMDIYSYNFLLFILGTFGITK